MTTHATFDLPDAAATDAFAARIAGLVSAGTCLLLEGPIGAGKTSFARALIQSRLGPEEEVPSPTFTLVQTYEGPDYDIWHCDLYRLTSADELVEIGLEDAFETALCLIEWPDRLGDAAPDNATLITFEPNTTDGRTVTVTGTARWLQDLTA